MTKEERDRRDAFMKRKKVFVLIEHHAGYDCECCGFEPDSDVVVGVYKSASKARRVAEQRGLGRGYRIEEFELDK